MKIIIVVVALLAAGGIFWFSDSAAPNDLLGGDRDEGGCIVSAGYAWCEEKQKCLRIWEESCRPESKIGYIRRLYEENGKRLMEFDEVKWLAAAEGGCVSETKPESDVPKCNPNGFLIVNESLTTEIYEVAAVTVKKTSEFAYSETGERIIGYESFVGLGTEHFMVTPYVVEAENGRIFRITEKYIP